MKNLTADDLKKIIARRDPRYDGRFYFGVATTLIYCRPICPARPKPQNIRLFKSSSEAEKAGYRPCLRCRPDAAPGSKFLDGTANSVARALRLIDEAGGDDLTIEQLADKLGMTDRHLRRLFDEHLGASPIDILITRRLHLARQLILQTASPLTDISFAAGFRSVRRFNEAFKALYKMTPSAMRKNRRTEPGNGGLQLSIPLRLPYDWGGMMAYFMRHETGGIERVTKDCYKRFIPQADGYAVLEVRYAPKSASLAVTVQDLPLASVRPLLTVLKHLFDSDHNPAHLPQNTALKPNGQRIPGAFDGFETAVTIILGQLVSTAQARKKASALVRQFGHKMGEDQDGDIFAFPAPEDLAKQELETLGMPRARADAIRGLSRAVLSGHIQLSPTADLAATRMKLLALRGIGPWTTELIAMRCLGDPDAFPKNDLVIARALADGAVNETEWRSARAYLTHCLWRDYTAPATGKQS